MPLMCTFLMSLPPNPLFRFYLGGAKEYTYKTDMANIWFLFFPFPLAGGG